MPPHFSSPKNRSPNRRKLHNVVTSSKNWAGSSASWAAKPLASLSDADSKREAGGAGAQPRRAKWRRPQTASSVTRRSMCWVTAVAKKRPALRTCSSCGGGLPRHRSCSTQKATRSTFTFPSSPNASDIMALRKSPQIDSKFCNTSTSPSSKKPSRHLVSLSAIRLPIVQITCSQRQTDNTEVECMTSRRILGSCSNGSQKWKSGSEIRLQQIQQASNCAFTSFDSCSVRSRILGTVEEPILSEQTPTTEPPVCRVLVASRRRSSVRKWRKREYRFQRTNEASPTSIIPASCATWSGISVISASRRV
mmetsp:Transcript_27354/g.68974  ORF Transcript_27354/g.68974 Transcript_27354/m.68974 type:complete len:307 (-) Transcript_27354:490-1410(-)